MAKTGKTQQIDTLQHLNQGSVAWLADLSQRSIRDAYDLRRHDDGSYDVRDVFAWLQGRDGSPPPRMPDQDYEVLLTISEGLCFARDQAAAGMLREFRRWQGVYGAEHLLTMLGRAMVDYLEDYVDFETRQDCPEVRKQQEAARREAEMESRAIAELRIATVCPRCKRVRAGRRWIKGTVPSDFYVVHDDCPDCAKRL